MLDRLEFMLSEALTALKRNLWMTFAAVSTSALALFLIGGLGYFYQRVFQFVNAMTGKFEMRVFLRDGIKKDEISAAAKEIRMIDGVKLCVWIPKETAWKKFRAENPTLGEGIDNPYPDGFKVVLNDLNKGDDVAAKIEQMRDVAPDKGVQYLRDDQRFLTQVLAFLRWLGFGLGGTLLLTAGVLIYNAIRLTIVARRREIRIMQLVGATKMTVQTPFLIEGFMQGGVGGALAGVMLFACQLLIQTIVREMSSLGQLTVLPLMSGVLILGVSGSLYGLFCSYLAVREPLKSL